MLMLALEEKKKKNKWNIDVEHSNLLWREKKVETKGVFSIVT